MTTDQIITLLSVYAGHLDSGDAVTPDWRSDLVRLKAAGLADYGPDAGTSQLTAKGAGLSAAILGLVGDFMKPVPAPEAPRREVRVVAAGVDDSYLEVSSEHPVYLVANARVSEGGPACLQRGPRMVHPSEGSAIERASELANLAPGCTFLILRSVATVRREVSPVVVTRQQGE
jgi:hypothetical protein